MIQARLEHLCKHATFTLGIPDPNDEWRNREILRRTVLNKKLRKGDSLHFDHEDHELLFDLWLEDHPFFERFLQIFNTSWNSSRLGHVCSGSRHQYDALKCGGLLFDQICMMGAINSPIEFKVFLRFGLVAEARDMTIYGSHVLPHVTNNVFSD